MAEEEEGWRTDNPPENVQVLVAWGIKGVGPAGYDVAKKENDHWMSCVSGSCVEAHGFAVFGWRRLPPLPKKGS